MVTQDFEKNTKQLIDSLKAICASYGLGNDGNEFKIITQVFLYKFLNDKFAYEAKKIDSNLAKAENWEQAIAELSADDLEMLQLQKKKVQGIISFRDKTMGWKNSFAITIKRPQARKVQQVKTCFHCSKPAWTMLFTVLVLPAHAPKRASW